MGSPAGSGVGASTPQRGGVEARSQVAAGTSSIATSDAEPGEDVAAQSARDAMPPLTR